jgi:hypothetical protein
MGHIGFAQIGRLRILLQVIVAIGQSQSTLIHFRNHLTRVSIIFGRFESEQYVVMPHARSYLREIGF